MCCVYRRFREQPSLKSTLRGVCGFATRVCVYRNNPPPPLAMNNNNNRSSADDTRARIHHYRERLINKNAFRTNKHAHAVCTRPFTHVTLLIYCTRPRGGIIRGRPLMYSIVSGPRYESIRKPNSTKWYRPRFRGAGGKQRIVTVRVRCGRVYRANIRRHHIPTVFFLLF